MKGCEAINKVLKTILISIISVVIILSSFVSLFIYETEYKLTTISKHTNPNNNYKILFQSVGEPFLFGPDKVKITLLDDKKKKVRVLSESISNDGGRAHEDNIKIKWFDNYVEITLSGSEQQDETYSIDYK